MPHDLAIRPAASARRGSTRWYAASLSLAAGLVAGAAGASDDRVDFVIGASTPHPRPFLRNGAPLWAIVPSAGGYRLERRVARVQTFEYRNAARGDETFTGQRLLGPQAQRALIHLAGRLRLREGPIEFDPSAHVLIDHSFATVRTPSRPISFALGDRVFRVVAEVAPAERGYQRLRVFLEEGVQRQELFASDEATDPYAKLAWIGDIDRDGRPDLLLSVRRHYSTTSHRLYLSSYAQTGQWCRHVGTEDEDND